MAANNKSLLPPAKNEIWVPAVPPKTQKGLSRRHKDKQAASPAPVPQSTFSEVSNALWLPPASPKESAVAASHPIRQPRRTPNIANLFKPIFTVPLTLGFKDKKFWDWLPLLIQLVAALAISASIFLGFLRFATLQSQQQDRLAQQTFQEQVQLAQQQFLAQQRLATQTARQQQLLLQEVGSIADQGHEQLLTAYLNGMTSLLPALKASHRDNSARLLAQTKTLAIFNALQADPVRLGITIQFLHDSGLISVPTRNTKGPILQLTNMTLSGLNLKQANLSGTSFDGVTLIGANFSQATLTSSSFRGATLTKIVLSNANLSNVDFSGANLENADLTGATLKGANFNGADTKNAKVKGTAWQ